MNKIFLALVFITGFITGFSSLSLAQRRQVITVNENGQLVRQRIPPSAPPQNSSSDFDGGAQMELPNYQGNGCPQGTLSATLSPDNKTLSVLYDNFISQAASNGIDRKLCRLRIPIKVSSGFQVAIVKLDWRGFTSLPPAARASIRTTHNITIKSGGLDRQVDRIPFTRETSFEGPLDEEIYIGEHVESEQVWSPCGANLAINIAATITLSNANSPDLAMVSVDSLDVQSDEKGMKYFLSWRRCEMAPSAPTHPPVPSRPVPPRPRRI